MKRLLTTLAILLVVLVAGMAALVLLINPNDFRAYMVKKVEQKSGYHLTLDGDLRWHVWPQLSILAGRMTLTAPGAAAPVVSADNMRLDVELLPLLSHQLSVKQVMLKNGVIRLTPDSEEQTVPGAPAAPTSNAEEPAVAAWKFDIDNLRIVDSLLIWQRANNEQINVRDINLTLQQNGQHQAQLALSSRVNRDQRDLAFTLAADLDLQQYPQQISANISQFTYQLDGADITNGGIKGEGSVQAVYQRVQQQLALKNMVLSANDSQLTGDAQLQFGSVPHYAVNLSSLHLNLDTLSGWKDNIGEAPQPAPLAPVIASPPDEAQSLNVLRDFTAQLALKADRLTYRGLEIAQLALQAENQRGLLTLGALGGKLAGGEFSLPGELDVRSAKPAITLRPDIKQIELGPVLKAFDMPQVITGKFNLQGTFGGDKLSAEAFKHSWHGDAQLAMQNVQLHGLNIQQLIQQAVARSDSRVSGQEKYQRYTEVQRLTARAHLNAGAVKVSELQADSSALNLRGAGTLDIPGKQCDMTLNVQVTDGWQGNNDLIALLRKTAIPLRVYGPWDRLNYQLKVDQLLRQSLQNRAKDALNKWAEKNKDSQSGQDLKRLLDKL
ncbi:AsmA protein [Gibbsiella quercinecans]|uniref:Outer membrane assembly protein AsmA n=1 Tax=Gibbsiella quercinecans TaxID=929813 RepID=A0A250AY59_9GAMM|nr:outer membrane assembly protein AsmA [Gibbsiella quercinecans]ATA18632.1 outer membrane assembly protein AsmA [Gibbsiella quercinecans]RLM14880.1 outer membrane assembly protein AsmA [Gibbsiella quercinecans]TCT91853.1 AsmA protein [Gibbsiella quercinecans]